MKAIVEYTSLNKNKCSFCFEKLFYLKFCIKNVVAYKDDKIVVVLVSFLNVEKSQYKEFKGLRLFHFKCLLEFSKTSVFIIMMCYLNTHRYVRFLIYLFLVFSVKSVKH